MNLRFKNAAYQFPGPALVMGILNVTPDSFFDGGRYLEPAAAVRRGLELVAEGADWIDVGGESTRPGAAPVELDEELRRVIPVIRGLRLKTDAVISVDTQKLEVARAALAEGAQVVNDVGANRTDPALWRLVAESGAGYVAMHMRGTPQTMQGEPHYADVIREVHDFLAGRLALLEKAGVSRDQVALDVGVGFGKSTADNLRLIANIGAFGDLGRPLLLGVSRKSFLGAVTGAEAGRRMAGGLACAVAGAWGGAAIIRTHDVAETRDALRLTEAMLAQKT